MTEDLWVVKSRRFYDGTEVISVLSAPAPKGIAALALAELNNGYQEPGNFYLERWVPRSD